MKLVVSEFCIYLSRRKHSNKQCSLNIIIIIFLFLFLIMSRICFYDSIMMFMIMMSCVCCTLAAWLAGLIMRLFVPVFREETDEFMMGCLKFMNAFRHSVSGRCDARVALIQFSSAKIKYFPPLDFYIIQIALYDVPSYVFCPRSHLLSRRT